MEIAESQLLENKKDLLKSLSQPSFNRNDVVFCRICTGALSWETSTLGHCPFQKKQIKSENKFLAFALFSYTTIQLHKRMSLYMWQLLQKCPFLLYSVYFTGKV